MEQDSTVSCQTSCFLSLISLAILASSRGMAPSARFAARSSTLSAIMLLVCCVSPGVKLGILPCGMLRLEALSRMFLKIFSPASHEEGGGRRDVTERSFCFHGEVSISSIPSVITRQACLGGIIQPDWKLECQDSSQSKGNSLQFAFKVGDIQLL